MLQYKIDAQKIRGKVEINVPHVLLQHGNFPNDIGCRQHKTQIYRSSVHSQKHFFPSTKHVGAFKTPHS